VVKKLTGFDWSRRRVVGEGAVRRTLGMMSLDGAKCSREEITGEERLTVMEEKGFENEKSAYIEVGKNLKWIWCTSP
jgi:hypothetical protein